MGEIHSLIEITVRPYRSEIDDKYIYSTWTRYSWYSPAQPIHTPKKQFFQDKIKEIKHILEHGYTAVACFKDDPNTIMGYIAVHDGVVQWMCIKKQFSNEGIDSLLLKSIKGRLNEK